MLPRNVTALVAVAAIGLFACTGTTDTDGSLTLVSAAVTATTDTGTAAFTMDITTTGTVNGQAMPTSSIHGEGVHTFETTDMEMSMQASAPGLPGGTIDMQIKSIGSVLFMKFPPELFGQLGIPAGVEWLSMDFENLTGLTAEQLQQLGGQQFQTPSEMLALLESVGADIQELGREVVAGLEVTKYAASTTFGALMDDQSELIDEMLGSQGVSGEFLDSLRDVVIPINLWIDDDGLARRFEMKMDMTDAVNALAAQQGEDVQSFVVTVDMTFIDFGVPVDIQPPPAEQTMDAGELFTQAF